MLFTMSSPPNLSIAEITHFIIESMTKRTGMPSMAESVSDPRVFPTIMEPRPYAFSTSLCEVLCLEPVDLFQTLQTH